MTVHEIKKWVDIGREIWKWKPEKGIIIVSGHYTCMFTDDMCEKAKNTAAVEVPQED